VNLPIDNTDQSKRRFPKIPRKFIIPGAIVVLLFLVIGVFAYVGFLGQGGGQPNVEPNPGGAIHASITTLPNTGSVTFTATGVHGANGAQVDNVRYFLLNPTLAPGNNWGNPDWCSGGAPCTQATKSGLITYDISQSSNPADNYAIVWDKNTHSSGSTPYSRALTSANILPGTYQVGLRVEDVNGKVAGGASVVTVTITKGTTSNPPCFFTNSSGKKQGYGDIDNNGIVDYTGDVMLVAQISQGLITPTADQKKAADVDGNGIVNFVGDVMDIANYANGVISTFRVCSIPTPTPTPPACSFIDSTGSWHRYGDVDGNGIVNYSGDVILATKISQGLITPTADQKKAADVDGNKVVNFTGDVMLINEYVNGIITTFPACSIPTPTPTPPSPTPGKLPYPPCFFIDSTGKWHGYGDVDGNGIVNYTGDAMMTAKIALGQITPTADQKKAADVDGNGIVNYTGDTILVAQYALGVISTFPVCSAPTPQAAVVPGCYDFDGDRTVTDNDLALIKSHQGETLNSPKWDPKFDLNRDGVIDQIDISAVQNQVGRACLDIR